MWTRPDDVRLSLIQKAKIWFNLLEEDIDSLKDDAIGGCICLGLVFFLQGVWYFILRHNSPANTATFMSAIGCLASAFIMSLMTIGSIGMLVFFGGEAHDKIKESGAYAEYKRREVDKKKQLFDKIEKDLLGDEYEL